jgi:hypothetical protein
MSGCSGVIVIKFYCTSALAINRDEFSRSIVLAAELPPFADCALPFVLLPLVSGVVYPDAAGIEVRVAALTVGDVGDFVMERYYVYHRSKRLSASVSGVGWCFGGSAFVFSIALLATDKPDNG